jgi:tripartite-type tricarboxylate transporter receptor subunit TctC
MRVCVVSLLVFTASIATAAETYPSRPVRMILPVAPSGGSDITARAIAPKLIEYLGQQVIIDNRPGGGGTVGMTLAARAAPDGYTFIQSSIGPTAVDQSLHSKMPYISWWCTRRCRCIR